MRSLTTVFLFAAAVASACGRTPRPAAAETKDFGCFNGSSTQPDSCNFGYTKTPSELMTDLGTVRPAGGGDALVGEVTGASGAHLVRGPYLNIASTKSSVKALIDIDAQSCGVNCGGDFWGNTAGENRGPHHAGRVVVDMVQQDAAGTLGAQVLATRTIDVDFTLGRQTIVLDSGIFDDTIRNLEVRVHDLSSGNAVFRNCHDVVGHHDMDPQHVCPETTKQDKLQVYVYGIELQGLYWLQ